MKFFFASAFSLFHLLLPTSALPDAAMDTISGKWSGHAAAGATLIDSLWEIDRTGDTVKGTISLKFQNDGQWSRYAFEGQITDGSLSFTGTKWLEKNQNFCLAKGALTIARAAGRTTLVGEWGPNQIAGGCPIGASGSLNLSQIEIKAPVVAQVAETDSQPSPKDMARFDSLIAAFFETAPDADFNALKSLQVVFEKEDPAKLLAAGSAYLADAPDVRDKMRASVLLGAAHSLATIKTYSAASTNWPPFPDQLVAPLGKAAHDTALVYLDQAGGDFTGPEVKAFLDIATHAGHQDARLKLAEIFPRKLDQQVGGTGQANLASPPPTVSLEQPPDQVAVAPVLPITINGKPAVFVTDRFLYKVYTIENPCIEKSRRTLDFRIEFRDPALARDPEIIAQAVREAASSLKRWRSEYTCIDDDNFVGNAISYYDGNLMYRAKVHVTSNLRETKVLSGEKLGKLVRPTRFSLIIRALGSGEYGGYGSGKAFRSDDLFNDLDSVDIREEEKSGRDFIVGFQKAQLANRVTSEARERLELASKGGSEGATLRLLSDSGVEDVVFYIRSRTSSGVTSITPEETATLKTHKDLIDRALSQRVGSVMLLESELARFGLSFDADGPSQSQAPSAESQVLPFVKEKFIAGKFCGGIRSYNNSIWSDSQVGEYFRTSNGCGIRMFTGANATYSFVDLTNDGCTGSTSCHFSTRIVCVWEGLVMAQACEGFEGRGMAVSGTVFFRDGMANRYTIN
jgi:hypothetical protein